MEDANGKSLKPYPVFSMMSVPNNEDCNNSHDLLAGGGDRFVTVWRKSKRENCKVDIHNVVWEVEDQLGPHTEWVKDLACHHGPA